MAALLTSQVLMIETKIKRWNKKKEVGSIKDIEYMYKTSKNNEKL